MKDVFERIAALREKYPDDVKRIEEDEARIKALLQSKAFSELDETKKLITLCRRDIIEARRKLATDRSLLDDPEAQEALWFLIDSRQWFISMAAKDFESELKIEEMALQAELER